MSDKKIIIVGNAGVGKTNLINRLLNKKFENRYKETTQFNQYKINNNITIYDTPGQLKYKIKKYFPKVKITHCIIMFDVTSQMSYNSINFWAELLMKIYGNIKFLIIGNKIDDSKYRKVYKLNANISVKDNKNIKEIREQIII